jgi:hypothetical protein
MENFKCNQIVAAIKAMTIKQTGGLPAHLKGRRNADGVGRRLLENLAKRHCPHLGGTGIYTSPSPCGEERFARPLLAIGQANAKAQSLCDKVLQLNFLGLRDRSNGLCR